MTESMSYTATSQYLPPQYYPTSPITHDQVHVVSQQQLPRQEVAQRKRPKYTRSKTGCLTCRVKKIKCDETKPSCMRCTHGQRDCTWPEGVPARKKPASRKDSVDGRPSTAGSSGVSEGSTPPTREHTPPRRPNIEMNILPLASRRPNDPYIHLQPMVPEHDSRRQMAHDDRNSGYQHHSPNSNILSMIPESQHPYSPRYEHSYSNGAHPIHASRHSISTNYRSLGHQPLNQWNPPPESLESYYPSLQERTLIGHSSPIDSHNRYQ